MQADEETTVEPEPEESPSQVTWRQCRRQTCRAGAGAGGANGLEHDARRGETAKEALKAEVADGLSGSKPDRAVVGEILLALEAQNPTSSPATSSCSTASGSSCTRKWHLPASRRSRCC